jgi:hypothetical protein
MLLRIFIVLLYIVSFWAFLNTKAHGCESAFKSKDGLEIPTKFSLQEDLNNQLLDRMTASGIKVTEKQKTQTGGDIVYLYLNTLTRQIPAQKYVPVFSVEFATKYRTLSPDLQQGIIAILNKLYNGHSVVPHLSTRIKNADYNDALFNDWNIYHLHLGTKLRSDGFVERTNNLLYVTLRGNHVFFIDVLDHSPIDGFANRDLLEIIHTNWPDILAFHKIKGTVVEPFEENAQVDFIRKQGISVPHQMKDGTAYMGIGGGYSFAGTNIQHTMRSNTIFHHLRRQQYVMTQESAHIIDEITKLKGEAPNELHFRLNLDGHTGQIYEDHTQVFIGQPVDLFPRLRE